MKIGGKIIPEVLNNYKVYDNNGNQEIGITGALTLAPIAMMTATISGAGIGGEYNTPVVGKTQSIQQEVPFRIFYGDMAKFADPTRQTGVTVRGALQCKDSSTMLVKMVPFRCVIRGNVTNINPGSVQVGNAMDGSITWEVLYMLFEVGGETVVELDKLNDIYIVDGEDVTADIRRMC